MSKQQAGPSQAGPSQAGPSGIPSGENPVQAGQVQPYPVSNLPDVAPLEAPVALEVPVAHGRIRGREADEADEAPAARRPRTNVDVVAPRVRHWTELVPFGVWELPGDGTRKWIVCDPPTDPEPFDIFTFK